MKNMKGLREFIQDIVSGRKKMTRYRLTPNNVWTLERVYNEIVTTGNGTFFGDVEVMKPIFDKFGLSVTERSGYVCSYNVKEA